MNEHTTDNEKKLTSFTSVDVDERSSYSVQHVPWWKKVLKAIEIDHPEGLTQMQLFLYNYDLRPVEEKRRTWKWYNFVFFWLADSFNINTWQIAATGVGPMNWWQAWLSVWLGYFLCGIFVSVGARVGIYYHISFPVAVRSSFGIFGSIWPVINRVFMSAVWFAVQCAVAGPCVEVMLRSIFGKNLDKTMPDGIHQSDLSTFTFLSFFLFWLFTLPFIWLPPHKVRHLFTVKAYTVPFAGFGFLIWALVKAKGAGPVIHAKPQAHGSELAWAFIISTMNALANFVTLIVNAPDFSRFATKPTFSMKYLVYVCSITLCFSITALIGILVTSAGTSIYGESFWSPLDVLKHFLNDYTAGTRAGCFLIGLGFAIAQLGTNISANSLSFGTDVTAMLPKYLNIRRGGYLCAMLALPICPWNLVSTSSTFTTYLSAYTVFLSSIAGVVACDYYFVRRGYIKLPHLYSLFAPEDHEQPSIYKYNFTGCNWRAFAAYFCGIAPNITGFVGATGVKVPMGATYIYRVNFFAGFFPAFLVYAVLCYLSPVAGAPVAKPFEKKWLEEWQDVEDFEEEVTGHIVHQAIEPTMSYTSGKSNQHLYQDTEKKV